MTEDYCQIEAWKRLKEKGLTPSQSYNIANEVYHIIKGDETNEGIRQKRHGKIENGCEVCSHRQ